MSRSRNIWFQRAHMQQLLKSLWFLASHSTDALANTPPQGGECISIIPSLSRELWKKNRLQTPFVSISASCSAEATCGSSTVAFSRWSFMKFNVVASMFGVSWFLQNRFQLLPYRQRTQWKPLLFYRQPLQTKCDQHHFVYIRSFSWMLRISRTMPVETVLVRTVPFLACIPSHHNQFLVVDPCTLRLPILTSSSNTSHQFLSWR